MTATRETLREAVAIAIAEVPPMKNLDQADAALSAIEAAGWRIVPAKDHDLVLAASPATGEFRIAELSCDVSGKRRFNAATYLVRVGAFIRKNYGVYERVAPRIAEKE